MAHLLRFEPPELQYSAGPLHRSILLPVLSFIKPFSRRYQDQQTACRHREHYNRHYLIPLQRRSRRRGLGPTVLKGRSPRCIIRHCLSRVLIRQLTCCGKPVSDRRIFRNTALRCAAVQRLVRAEAVDRLAGASIANRLDMNTVLRAGGDVMPDGIDGEIVLDGGIGVGACLVEPILDEEDVGP